MSAVYDPEQLEGKEQAGGQPFNSSSTSPGNINYSPVPQTEQSFYNSSATTSGNLKFSNLFRTRRRKIIGGGTIAGGIIGTVLVFTFISGPFQFIHMAELLKGFHFTSHQDAADGRYFKMVRWMYYKNKGQPERARMGFVGNRIADNAEASLERSGIKPRFDKGIFLGYGVDPKLLAGTQLEELRGKSPTEIKAFLEGKFKGLTVSIASDGTLLFDNSNLQSTRGVLVQRRLGRYTLQVAGYSKLSSALMERSSATRARLTLHPIPRKINQVQRNHAGPLTKEEQAKQTADDNKKWNAQEWQYTQNGAQDPWSTNEVSASEDPNGKTPDEKAKPVQNATATKHEADIVKGDGDLFARQYSKAGGGGGFGSYLGGLKKRLGGGQQKVANGIAFAGVACLAYGVAQRADEVKQTQVILPLMRLGMEAISLGDQIKSGQGVDMEQLGFFNSRLNGISPAPDKKSPYYKKKVSWTQAESIQAELGNANTGLPPDATLQTISSGSPFDFLNDIPGLKQFCKPGVQGVMTFLGWSGDAIINILYMGIGLVATPYLEDALSHWLAGQAIDNLPSGAKYGNYVNYGAKLAANDQAMASGGRVLNSQEVNELKTAQATDSQIEFQNHNIAYKLFNPYDYHSAMAKLIDRQDPNPSDTVSNFGSWLLHFPHLFGNLTQAFDGVSHAATPAPYNYSGIPTIGFSQAELSNPAVDDPFQNADQAVDILNGSNGNKYRDRASKCFGVNIGNADTKYQVSAANGHPPEYKDIKDSECGDPGNQEWLRVRFYIFDSQVMDGAGCFYDEQTSCDNLGLGNTASPDTTDNISGDISGYRNPLRDVQKNGSLVAKRIDQGVDYGGHGPVYAIGTGRVLNVYNSGWPGGTFIVYKLSDGPAAGKFVFFAENCTPKVTIGSPVTSDTVICIMVDADPHIETGWADGSALGNAKAHDVWGSKVDDEDHYTAYGLNFSQLLEKLGAPAGTIKPGAQKLGSLERGWPAW